MRPVAAPLCLVAEDQAVIAIGLETDLADAGIAVAGPFASCAQALGWLEGHTPHMALLDVRLKDGPCIELARTLLGRGVPVMILSGLPRGPDTPPELRDLPWIEKPVPRQDLIDALLRLLPVEDRPTAGVIEETSVGRS